MLGTAEILEIAEEIQFIKNLEDADRNNNPPDIKSDYTIRRSC